MDLSLAVNLASWAMNLAPAEPPLSDDPRYSQIFDHPDFLAGDADLQRKIRFQSSDYRFQYEIEERFFPKSFPDFDLSKELNGAKVLDLGCLTGGRTAAWTEMFGIGEAHGIDIEPVYIQAAEEFAKSRGHNSHFQVSPAELLPFPNDSFDAVATLDVLEHVQSVAVAMSEVMRVLRPGGKLFAVFPGYYNPLESHLELATRMPGLNLLFPGTVLAEAHYRTISSRGPGHDWYAGSPELPSFYKSPFLNGVTLGQFRAIVKDQGWKIEAWPVRPLFSVGRRAQRAHFRALARLARPLAKVKLLEEVFGGSVAAVLVKPLA